MRFWAPVVLSFLVSALSLAQSDHVQSQKLSDRELIACAQSRQPACGQYEDPVGELAKRNHPEQLSKLYSHTNPDEQYVILEAMYRMRGPAVTHFMRQVAYSAPRDAVASEPLWFALQYMAERCEPEALERLLGSQNFEFKDPYTGYPTSCMLWDLTLRQFGKCDYRQAIPTLQRVMKKDYACLNIHEAAEYSLKRLRRKP